MMNCGDHRGVDRCWFQRGVRGAISGSLRLLLAAALVSLGLALAGPLSAEGPAVSLAADPPGLQFFGVYSGTVAGPGTITVTNSGTEPLIISGVSLQDPDPWSVGPDFAIVGGGEPGTVAPDESRVISVLCQPQSPGTHFSHVHIVDNAPDSPQVVSVSTLAARRWVQLQPSPTSVDFGAQALGTTSASQAITFANGQGPSSGPGTIARPGSAPIYLEGPGAASFVIVSGGESGALDPHGSRTVNVAFQPTSPGAKTATLVISVYDIEQGHFVSASVPLSGFCTSPLVSLSASSLSFAPQRVGIPSAAQSVTLTNTGDLPLAISSISLAGPNAASFALTEGFGSGSIAPGASRTVSVSFTPAAIGSFTASLSMASNAPGSPHGIALSGTGIASAVSPSPTSLDFGPQTVGKTTAPQSVTLTNTGNASLTISSISLGGANPDSFAIIGGGSGSTLAPGASQTVSLTFSPPFTGSHSASLVIVSDAPGSSRQVSLVGVGGIPGISLSPPSVEFGPVELGLQAIKNVTVTNTGTAPLVIAGASLSGDRDFVILQGGGAATLAPGASRTISLAYRVTVVGESRTTLAIDDDAPGAPHTVPVSGTGTNPTPVTAPAVTVSPASVSFGSQLIGSMSAVQSIQVGNNGTAPLLIQSISLTGADAGEFRIVSGSGGTVSEGGTRTLGLTFNPTAAGSRTAFLSISDNAAGSPHTVRLAGTGTVPPDTAPAGDWPVFMHDPRQLGLTTAALDPRSLSRWSVVLGSPPAPGASLSPVVRRGVAYIGTEAGGVFAIDLKRRALLWNRPLPAPVRSAPAAWDSRAAAPGVVVVSAGALYGLSPVDGTILWQRPDIVAGDDISPMLVDDAVYLGARGPGGSGVLYAVRADTGANLWPAPAPLPAGLEVRTTVAAYPELGRLYVGLGPSAGAPQPNASPGAVLALSLATGALAWSGPVPLAAGPPGGLSLGWVGAVPVPPAADSRQPAVFVTAGSRITALNAASGALLWTRALPETTLLGPPPLSSAGPLGATLYVGGASGRIYALDSSTGGEAPGSGTAVPAALAGPLALVDQYLYAPTASGLIAVDAAHGTPLWSSPLTAAGGVAVAEGSPYVATTDGLFVGFSAQTTAVVHDLAITSLQVAPQVSRFADAPVKVVLANQGSESETYHLLLRVQPGAVLIPDAQGTIAPGETKTLEFTWPIAAMGDDGVKTVIAQVSLQGQVDSSPNNNTVFQVVTVGP
jgi:outer membrane protein assembly factor BamB